MEREHLIITTGCRMIEECDERPKHQVALMGSPSQESPPSLVSKLNFVS